MAKTIILLIFFFIFCVSLYCVLVLYKWKLFKKLKKGDRFGQFIDYNSTVDICVHTITHVETNECGETIKVYTDEGKSFTFFDYVKENIKLLNEDDE